MLYREEYHNDIFGRAKNITRLLQVSIIEDDYTVQKLALKAYRFLSLNSRSSLSSRDR
jgi:hypothetical protein